MIDVATDTSGTLGCCGDVRLTREPGRDAVGGVDVGVRERPPVAAQAGGVPGSNAAHRGQPLLKQAVDPDSESLGVLGVDGPVRQNVFLERVEPGIQHGTEGAGGIAGGGESLAEPPIDRLQPVQRGFGLGDLYLGEGHPAGLGQLADPPRDEGLP